MTEETNWGDRKLCPHSVGCEGVRCHYTFENFCSRDFKSCNAYSYLEDLNLGHYFSDLDSFDASDFEGR